MRYNSPLVLITPPWEVPAIATRRRAPRRRSTSRTPRRNPRDLEELRPTSNPPEINSFDEWDLAPEVLDTIAGMGITVPTPIQQLAIGPVLEGHDVIAKAETGTGKTLAFGAPIMSLLDPERASVLALVLCPTRELAQQVAGVLEELGRPRDLRVALVVGGEPLHPQVQAVRAGAQVVVGTPGRVIDIYEQRFLNFPWTEFVVLDEADRMLEIGFIDEVRKILAFTPEDRQTLLFSATFPPEVLALGREHTRDPSEVATARGTSPAETVEQVWLPTGEDDVARVLQRLISRSHDEDIFLIFCQRRTDVNLLTRRLQRMPFTVQALHGGYDQGSRFRVMESFRAGRIKALVATDVASRGLDITLVTHVINASVPREVTEYTHRIGRTGRAGRAGLSITLVSRAEERRWRYLSRQMRWEVRQVEIEDLLTAKQAHPSYQRRRPAPPPPPGKPRVVVTEPVILRDEEEPFGLMPDAEPTAERKSAPASTARKRSPTTRGAGRSSRGGAKRTAPKRTTTGASGARPAKSVGGTRGAKAAKKAAKKGGKRAKSAPRSGGRSRS